MHVEPDTRRAVINRVCYKLREPMRKVSIFRNGKNQAIRLPKEFEFEGVTELEISRLGDAIVLRPSRQDWMSLADIKASDDDFLEERAPVVDDEGRVTL